MNWFIFTFFLSVGRVVNVRKKMFQDGHPCASKRRFPRKQRIRRLINSHCCYCHQYWFAMHSSMVLLVVYLREGNSKNKQFGLPWIDPRGYQFVKSSFSQSFRLWLNHLVYHVPNHAMGYSIANKFQTHYTPNKLSYVTSYYFTESCIFSIILCFRFSFYVKDCAFQHRSLRPSGMAVQCNYFP